jgi:hypothetical protein
LCSSSLTTSLVLHSKQINRRNIRKYMEAPNNPAFQYLHDLPRQTTRMKEQWAKLIRCEQEDRAGP